jgi:hypothetical protein
VKCVERRSQLGHGEHLPATFQNKLKVSADA